MVTNEQEGGATTWTVAETKNLTVEGERKSGTLIAKASGRIDGSNAREFQDALETFWKDEISSLVLDLENSPISVVQVSGSFCWFPRSCSETPPSLVSALSRSPSVKSSR